MFTSRAEYRLMLRADNADRRLTPKGKKAGLVGSGRQAAFDRKRKALDHAERLLRMIALSPNAAMQHGLVVRQDGMVRDGLALLRLPHIDMRALARVCPELGRMPPDVAQQFEIEARYAAYLPRQLADIAAFRDDEACRLPEDLALEDIAGLSREVRARLAEVRPETIGSAARIPGMTPAALALLYKHAKKAVSA
jgi:tRNA uridine 5-carboxymethylaminomethyl modification enzyme